jgi:hypothetical protein
MEKWLVDTCQETQCDMVKRIFLQFRENPEVNKYKEFLSAFFFFFFPCLCLRPCPVIGFMFLTMSMYMASDRVHVFDHVYVHGQWQGSGSWPCLCTWPVIGFMFLTMSMYMASDRVHVLDHVYVHGQWQGSCLDHVYVHGQWQGSCYWPCQCTWPLIGFTFLTISMYMASDRVHVLDHVNVRHTFWPV